MAPASLHGKHAMSDGEGDKNANASANVVLVSYRIAARRGGHFGGAATDAASYGHQQLSNVDWLAAGFYSLCIFL